ncbi:uncharacterized protein [Antedon mediterranea]|uniref:uncharacterized protein n=1 Tax=Antedon mediterranea TaxID=105859 RepID=UPI003AF89F2C
MISDSELMLQYSSEDDAYFYDNNIMNITFSDDGTTEHPVPTAEQSVCQVTTTHSTAYPTERMLYYSSSEDDEVGLIVRGNGSIQSINNGCSAVDDTEGSPTGISTTEVPPAAKRKAWEVSTTDVDTSDDDIPTESADSVCLVTTTKVPPAAERKAWEVSTTDVDTSDVDTSDDDISAACKRNTGGLETVETNYLNSSGSSDDEIKISNHTSKRSGKFDMSLIFKTTFIK